MKKSIIFSAILTATVVMVSCNVEDVIEDNVPVKFTSGITATPQLRSAIDGSGNSVWEQGDPIGIYMVGNGGIVVAESVNNIKYTAVSAGASTAFDAAGATIYYPVNVSEKVDFIAYHPRCEAVMNWTYQVNVATQTPQTAIDLMWAKADNSGAGYDKTNTSPINFTFGHQLVKLVINVSKGVAVAGNISAVSINGMNTAANFDLTGVGGLSGMTASQAITPHTVTADATYEAILLPVTALDPGHTVAFTIGADTYIWSMSNDITGLQTGKIYTYDVTLTKHEVEVRGSITKWSVGASGTGMAE